VEHSYVAASKGAVDFNLKLIDIAQENVNAAFDFARELQHAPSPSAFFELSAAYTRKQCEKLAEQTQHLTGLAQKGTIDAVQSPDRRFQNVEPAIGHLDGHSQGN
jgi:hypothetical protein